MNDVLAIQRASGRLIQAVGCGWPNRLPAVEGLAEAIEDAADEIGPDGHLGILPAWR